MPASTARPPGRPLNTAIEEQLLRATQDLLIEEGFERLTMDAVAQRCGASKATIYRRWPSKTALAVAAAAALFPAPEVPDTGDLRADLLACGRAYIQHEGRNAQVLASVISASRHDPVLREAAHKALGTPFGGLFDRVLARAVARGVVHEAHDIATVAQVFPAMAYQQVAAQGRLVTESDVQRVVDAVLLPALGHHAGDQQDTPTRSTDRRRRPR
jgi:AcrR family transcriptional regulator